MATDVRLKATPMGWLACDDAHGLAAQGSTEEEAKRVLEDRVRLVRRLLQKAQAAHA